MSVEQARRLLLELHTSPTFTALPVQKALAVIVETAAPDLLTSDGTINVADLRAILQDWPPTSPPLHRAARGD